MGSPQDIRVATDARPASGRSATHRQRSIPRGAPNLLRAPRGRAVIHSMNGGAMKRAVMALGLVALSVVQVGCVLPQQACEVPNNGNQGELSFGGWQSPAQGMLTAIRILRRSTGLGRGP